MMVSGNCQYTDVAKKRIAVQIVFSENCDIPIYQLYRPPLILTNQHTIFDCIIFDFG